MGLRALGVGAVMMVVVLAGGRCAVGAEAAGGEGWVVMFRGDDSNGWDSGLGDLGMEKGYGAKVAAAPEGVKYVRVKRMDTGEAVIVGVTGDKFKAGGTIGGTFMWSGGTQSWSESTATHKYVGIGEYALLEKEGEGAYVYPTRTGETGYGGYGFARAGGGLNKMVYEWAGADIGHAVVFEIAVKAGALTAAEDGELLVPGVLKVTKATWGPGGKGTDVTALVQGMVKGGWVELTATTAVLGASKGNPELVVAYEANGKAGTAKAEVNKGLRISAPPVHPAGAAVAGGAAAVAAVGKGGGGGEVTSHSGRFQAVFPGVPKAGEQNLTTGIGEITNHTWDLNVDRSHSFTVMWNDYPGWAVKQVGAEKMMENIAKGFVKAGEKLVSDKPVAVAGVSGAMGRELVKEVNGTLMVERNVMVGERLYQAIVVKPADGSGDVAAGKFLDSLTVLDERDFGPRGFRLEKIRLEGWSGVRPQDNTMAFLVYGPGSTEMAVKSAVKVVAVRPRVDKTLEQTAADQLKLWGGTEAPEAMKLDGEAAMRLKVAGGKDLSPVEAVVALHGGMLYVVVGATTPGQDCHGAVEEIVRSWKWEPMTDISEELEFYSGVAQVLPGVAMNYPQGMWMESGKEKVQLEMYDAAANAVGFAVQVEVLDLGEGVGMEAREATIKARLAKDFTGDLEWKARPGEVKRAVTGIAWAVPPGEKEKKYYMWGWSQLDEKHAVLLAIMMAEGDAGKREKLAGAARRMVDSVLPMQARGE